MLRQTFIGIFCITAFSFSACTPPSNPSPVIEAERTGDWVLSGEESGMTYITVKLGEVAEINTFRNIAGTVTAEGKATIEISLDSVDTNNEIRDPRMKEVLFETAKFPLATASTTLDMSKFEGLAIGERHTELLDMTIDLHGVSERYDFYVLVTRLGANKVSVENKAPLLLDARDFGMEAGLAKLQELARLDSITPVVPITMSLVFERKK